MNALKRCWLGFSASCLALAACEARRAPAVRERTAPVPALASAPAPAKPNPDLEQAIAADRANEFRKLSLFLGFAKTARKQPQAVTGIEECGGAGSGNAGLCSKIYASPGFNDTWLVSYVKAHVGAFRLQAVFGNVRLSCADLGAGPIVRSWQHGSADKQHCTLSTGPLAGLQALLESYPGNAKVFAFSQAYLERDLAFKAVVEAEGTPP